MSRTSSVILVLIFTSAALAQSPQPRPVAAHQPKVPWVVSVVHTIDVEKMVELMRGQQKLRVGVAGSAPAYIYNITTGLILDDQGHVVTRLANLDPQDKEHKLTVTTSDGSSLDAKLIGVDFATGFAVLEVASLKSATPKTAVIGSLANGVAVKILSSDVVPRSITDKMYLAPSITVSQGRVFRDSIYSKARGAMTLLSDSLLARSDSSVVLTPEDQIVGMAQYAGFGRAYLYPIQLIRDTIARRVIEKKNNVPAGWLGLKGDSVAQLSDADVLAMGLQNRAGVIVQEVTPQGSAFQAGLMPRDVIVGVDDFEIAGIADLRAVLSSLPAGRLVKLRALRDRQPMELKAVLGPKPLTEPASPIDQALDPALSQRDQLNKRLNELKSQHYSYQKRARSRETAEALRELEIEIRQIYDTLIALQHDSPSLLPTSLPRASPEDLVVGLTVEAPTPDISFAAGFIARDLSSQLAASLQARGGVLVTGVAKDSPADRAGLTAGDVIVGAQDRVLLSATQLQVLLAAQRSAVALKVVRKKQEIPVTLNLQ